MQGFTTCLWFDDKAEEAAEFYTSIFSRFDSAESSTKVLAVNRYDQESSRVSGKPKGSIMTVLFQLRGQNFLALNGGPLFTFSPATSFMVNCDTQDEIDWFWEQLSRGGKPDQCGWLTDQYGVTWQIVPTILQEELLHDKDAARKQRVMKALLQMKKLDIAGLKQAYEGA
jgi:predicted 3-demethylubiquinone-9 3-methyltransferase (glyoxalase superfamily)